MAQWDGEAVSTLAERWGVPRVEAYPTLTSTNDRARVLSEAGCPPWTTVVADAQTRGRGRRGSTWLSDAGTGLLLSVVVPESVTGGTLTLRAGLACAEALEASAPELEVGLKWPNDLVVQGRKVGGILCEKVQGGVVVGVGVNVSGAPDARALSPAPALPPAALEEVASRSLSRNELAGSIVAALRQRLTGEGEGMDVGIGGGVRPGPGGAKLSEAVLSEIARRDVLGGRQVVTEEAGEGRAVGIDATGALRLRLLDGGEVRIVSGGVRLSSSADASAGAPTGCDRDHRV